MGLTQKLGALVVLASALHAPALGAQSWSPAQQAVLDRLTACYQSLVDRNAQAELDCYHPDFLGWQNSMPATRNFEFIRTDVTHRHASPDASHIVSFSIQPLAVMIHGNIAIIHYYSYTQNRAASGPTTAGRARWTDIMLNEGGKWAWIADHGGSDPGSPPPSQPPGNE